MVIPILHEAEIVGAPFERLLRTPGVSEVVVSDGGSTNGASRVAAPR